MLYASQGQYEKARQALEMSIRTHPAYATAYENLGDVYSKLASQAYDKALQLDNSNQAAKSKLALMTELISGSGRPRTAVAGVPQPARPAEKAAPPQQIAQAPKAPEPAKAAPEARKAEKQAESKPAPKPAAGAVDPDEVLKTVQGWARAWSAKDVKSYLGYYSPDFKTPGGEARAAWANGRQQRISAPKKIEVSVEAPKVTVNGNEATVTFRQNYRSDSLKNVTSKTLHLSRTNGKWLITQERVGR